MEGDQAGLPHVLGADILAVRVCLQLCAAGEFGNAAYDGAVRVDQNGSAQEHGDPHDLRRCHRLRHVRDDFAAVQEVQGKPRADHRRVSADGAGAVGAHSLRKRNAKDCG